MKQKSRFFKPYGLRARFAITMVLSALLCVLVFLVLYQVSNYLLTKHFDTPEYLDAQMQRQGESLQAFVNKNDISSSDLSRLEAWEKQQPAVLLELYADGSRIYSSIDDMLRRKAPREEEPPGADRPASHEGEPPNADPPASHDDQHVIDDRSVLIHLTDRDVRAEIFTDTPYQYNVIATSVSAMIAVALFIVLFLLSTRKMIRYICRLNEEVQIIEGGDLDYEVSVEGNDEITDLARSMNRMRASFRQQMASETALHRANRRLVTELSHDLRTPLTGMMLYLEILRSHNYQTEEELQNYLEKIDDKARHMKQISDHLFSYALEKAPEHSALQTAEQAFSAAIAAFADELQEKGFRVVSNVNWSSCFVQVNQEYLQRILENGVSNIAKYAEPSAEVVISSIDTEALCGFSVMNTCAALDDPPESSGVGLESIRSMMRQMNGQCTVEQTETAYEITLLFPKQ